MVQFYQKQLEGRLFTKNGNEYPKYGIGGLGYRSEYTLRLVYVMKVGDKISIHGYTLERVK